MKVVGLITEYNPFHNGHKYHIEEARRVTGADYVIAVMSGNFVQRGAPAIIDKYSRSRMALQNGADIVFELPVCFSTASAEYFAHGAVSLLDKLGVVDYICFGSECGDIQLLKKAACLLTDKSKLIDERIQAYIKDGQSYPAARTNAMLKSLEAEGIPDGELIGKIINEPNNILGIEYIKAIQRLNSKMQAITIKRKAAHYHDLNLYSNQTVSTDNLVNKDNIAAISSATAIRRAILADLCDTGASSLIDDHTYQSLCSLNEIKDSVPDNVFNILMENYLKNFPITEDDFSQIIHYHLIYEDKNSLTEYLDVSADMADRIKNIRDTYYTIEEFYKAIKTKNLTLTRINRAMLHIMLKIRKSTFDEYCQNGYCQYARILGFKNTASKLLRLIDKKGSIPLISKVSKADEVLDKLGMQMLTEDIKATQLYNQIVYSKYKTKIQNEYKHGICII